MKKILIACAAALASVVAASTAEAACRQVYGGTSCNWLGKCWHNPPKTVCDAPAARINTTVAPRPTAPVAVNPNSGSRLVTDNGAGLISNRAAGVLSDNGLGARGGNLVGNNGNTFRPNR